MIRELGIELPIVQAPMAGVSTPALAAAVSNAGGLGSLGIGANTAAQAREAIEETRALTDRPFNVNVFCHAPAPRDEARESGWLNHLAPLFAEFGAAAPKHLNEIYESFLEGEEVFRVLLDARPPFVSFHFGLPPDDQIAAFHEAGIRTMASATSLAEARKIAAASVDMVVAQGIEAGGHRGVFDPAAADERHSTSVLTRLLVRENALPVIAAGGIMDGQGIRAALDLGAIAAQLGTAFILCPESAANAGYRENLRSVRASKTRLTPVLSGRPARGIVNRFIEYCEVAGSPEAAAYPMAYDAAKQLNAIAAAAGVNEFAAHWAGQGAPIARELPAAELVEALARELDAKDPSPSFPA